MKKALMIGMVAVLMSLNGCFFYHDRDREGGYHYEHERGHHEQGYYGHHERHDRDRYDRD